MGQWLAGCPQMIAGKNYIRGRPDSSIGTETYAKPQHDRSPDCSQTVDRRDVDPESLGDLVEQFPLINRRLASFSCCGLSLRGRPNRAPLLFAAIPPGRRPLPDQIPFELGDAGEHRHDHLAGVGSRVRPRLRDRLEAA